MEAGYRKANLAALYANLRGVLGATLREENPIVGLIGLAFNGKGEALHIIAGGTPAAEQMLSAIGYLQGKAVSLMVARQVGDMPLAALGDQFNPASGKTHCVGCEDGDPTGGHAEQELRENARAWLGLVIEIAEKYYGEYLTEEARAGLRDLKKEALPFDAAIG